MRPWLGLALALAMLMAKSATAHPEGYYCPGNGIVQGYVMVPYAVDSGYYQPDYCRGYQTRYAEWPPRSSYHYYDRCRSYYRGNHSCRTRYLPTYEYHYYEYQLPPRRSYRGYRDWDD